MEDVSSGSVVLTLKLTPRLGEEVTIEMPVETAKRLEEVDTELGELADTIQKALDRDFQEEYEVKDVTIDKDGLILVAIDLLEDVDED